MSKCTTYFCDHCKKKIKLNINSVDITCKSLSLYNSYSKDFKEDLYFCNECLSKIRNKLEAFVHRRFTIGKL